MPRITKNNNKQQQQRRGKTGRGIVLPREIKVSGDPPPVKQFVWINKTFVLRGTLSSTATNVLVDELSTGLAANSLRIHSAKVWCDAGNGALVVSFNDPTTGNPLSQIADQGNYASRPSAGYLFGDTIFAHPVLKTSTNEILQITNPTNGDFVVHIHYMALSPNFG